MANGKPGAPKGNTNGAKGKEFADALRKALVQYENPEIARGHALAKIAKTIVERAIVGDKDAWQEIGNRLDGKPHQTIAAEVDSNVTVEVVRFGKPDAKR